MAEWIVELGDGNIHIKKMSPLVRCKDCKWFTERNGEHLCGAWDEIFYNPVDKNGYCYKAERKDNAPTKKVDTPTENTNRPTNEVEE